MFRYRSHVVFCALIITAMFMGMCCIALAFPRSQSSSSAGGHTESGIDVLARQGFAPLRGKRVGLITNQTGVDSAGRRTIDLLAHARGVRLITLFSPEHGISGKADAKVEDAKDEATGLPIYSLYGATRRPTGAMLAGIDVLVFDIQDVGVRFYTYVTTMAYCMEEASKRHIPFYVLDRPDPLGGQIIEGPMLDADRTSFTGYFPMPVRYAMTIGELAQMFNAENKIGADLHVIAIQHWTRSETWDQTGLLWIPPSPNLPDINAALLYPGVEILRAGGVSVGRGTGTPFEIMGAPWIRADEFVAALNGRNIPGVSFASAQFTPKDGLYSGQLCQGATINIVNRDVLRPMLVGLEIANTLHRLYPEQFQLEKIIELVGSQSTLAALARGEPPADIVDGWSEDLAKFRIMREKYLLYH